MNIAFERTCLNAARTRAYQEKMNPASERQVQSMLFFMNKTGKTASDVGLSMFDTGAFLSKARANQLIASLAEELVCGKEVA